MATRENSNSPPAQTGSKDTSAPPDAPQGTFKAQAELERYKARMAAGGGAPAYGTGAQGVRMVPVAMPQMGTAMPGWAVPPSLAALSPPGAGDIASGISQAGGAAAGSLIEGLGSTLRLGIDLVNAALAGSVRMLNSGYGMGGGYAEAQYGGCGCSSCCNDCCGSDCGCNACCGGCGSCCSPHVGRCC